MQPDTVLRQEIRKWLELETSWEVILSEISRKLDSISNSEEALEATKALLLIQEISQAFIPAPTPDIPEITSENENTEVS